MELQFDETELVKKGDKARIDIESPANIINSRLKW